MALTPPMLTAEVNQSVLLGGQRLPLREVRRVLRMCTKMLGVTKPRVLSVAFVNEQDMRRLNKKYRGKDRVTDVLSFEEVDEILLCYPQAARQAKQLKHSTREELLFLLVHGVLHLFGYDHERPQDAKQMFPLQERILRALSIDPRL